ncbi:hypothetical protein Trco_005120 [Trichoderma cornu-damae]|uniref:RBR-type E3 ubiquitin transferase n=1 Tax=Trichoderma cornu-damae TaxID=654480 RepID=A0A9P8QP68_9HYPO|nr:hypothetical protein Trco_005120 [Trichoderma cornu-damae]
MNHEIDQDSLDLIIELQLQDARNMIKGKHREGEAPDFELALEFFNSELESLHTFLHDREMSRSLARAVVSDADIIRELVHEEERATRDRALALTGFAGDRAAQGDDGDFFPDQEPPCADSPGGPISDEMLRKLIVLFHGDDGPSSAAESSRMGGRARAPAETGRRRRCIVCNEDFSFVDILRCPCSHEYCRGCLSNYIDKATGDESIFPPRCCGQPIPLDGVHQIFIPADVLGRYRAKELEYNSSKRCYCHVPSCSTFIPAQFIRDEVATCVKCRSRTCVICRGASHEGDCPRDTATANFLRVAGDNGWKRCYKCRRMVELTHGCNHIYCHCKAEFCYVCGKRWKTCGCDLWNENMLFARANAAVNRF